MRPAALTALVVSLVLGAVAVSVTNGNVASRRGEQDQALQAATGLERASISSATQQTGTATALLAANPAARTLLTDAGASLSEAARHTAIQQTALSLQAIEHSAFLSLTAVCLDDNAGRQLACSPTAHGAVFPSLLGQQFLAALGGGHEGAASSPFISPVTGQVSVAFLSPVTVNGRRLGFLHMDVSSSETRTAGVVVNSTHGVRVELAAYEGGVLALNSPTSRLTVEGFNAGRKVPVSKVRISREPRLIMNGGHRAMAASLPLTFGTTHEGVAVVATAVASDPNLLNSWSTGMIAVLVGALVLFVGSLATLIISYRGVTRELLRDPLTGLRNRRKLLADLERVCRHATEQMPARLWFFDLNGFKRYNDAFGKLAGDTMLERLGERLHDAVKPYGTAYRVGGDEFCVLIDAPLKEPQTLLAEASEALCERGGAFDITACSGAVSIPRDTSEATQALLFADQRMYQEKSAKRADATEIITAVLHAALAQRHPDLGDHSNDVVEDAEMMARAIGLDEDALTLIVTAADLHDIGKLGVPDEIITKPGPLDDDEWEFIKQHTLIGERIIAAAGLPMEGIGQLVRSSHERWDGTGYPDGLVGEEVPLGSRIITICDAFGAMTVERAYKPAFSIPEALAELRRCAGTQFDPHLVEVFCRIITERTSAPERLRGVLG
jgi:diguanylate cyclase (GGDEF)-like protein